MWCLLAQNSPPTPPDDGGNGTLIVVLTAIGALVTAVTPFGVAWLKNRKERRDEKAADAEQRASRVDKMWARIDELEQRHLEDHKKLQSVLDENLALKKRLTDAEHKLAELKKQVQ